MGNFAKVCLSKNVRETTEEKKTDMEEVKESTYNINLFRFKSFYTTVIPKLSTKNNDFKVEVIVKNNLTSVIVDTGAKISVCGIPEANKWNLLSRMVPSKKKDQTLQQHTNTSPWRSTMCSIFWKIFTT